MGFTVKLPAKTMSKDAAPEAAVKQPPKENVFSAKPKTQATGYSFMKTGASAHAMLAEEEAKAQTAREEAGKLWRFWMPAGEERTVTFLDGSLDEEGMFAIPYWHEHNVKVAGSYDQFVCTMEREGTCPICESGAAKSYMIGAMTIIDHTPHEIQKGSNKGKIIQHRRKLYTPKRATIKTLLKIAQKHGGLAGMTMEITRGSEDDANVGSNFQMIQAHGSQAAAVEWMMNKFKIKDDEKDAKDYKPEQGGRFSIPSYEYEVAYRSADELIAMGIGKAPTGVGYAKSGIGKGKSVDKGKLADKM